MTDIDHAAEALGLRTLASEPMLAAGAANLLAAAQVHATLALVEQQRIANEQHLLATRIDYLIARDQVIHDYHREWIEEGLGL